MNLAMTRVKHGRKHELQGDALWLIFVYAAWILLVFNSGETLETFKLTFYKLRLYEVKDERHAEAFRSDVSLAKEDLLPIGERVAALKDDQQHSGIRSGVKFGPGGSREISFTSRSSAKYKEDEEDKELHRGKRRGVQSLGLKPETSGFRGRGRGFNRGRGRRGGGGGGSRGRGGGGGRGRGRGRGRW